MWFKKFFKKPEQKNIEEEAKKLEEIETSSDNNFDSVEAAIKYEALEIENEWRQEMEDSHEKKFINWIIKDAAQRGVTDIHFEPENVIKYIENEKTGETEEIKQPKIVIRYNINGEKVKAKEIEAIAYRRIISVLKDMYWMRWSESLTEQNGSWQIKYIDPKTKEEIIKRLRIAVAPTAYTYENLNAMSGWSQKVEVCVIRILSDKLFSLEDLWLLWYKWYLVSALKETGLILITWPTSHGKTTTLSWLLYYGTLIQPWKKYYAVEEPTEIIIAWQEKKDWYIPWVTPLEINEYFTKRDAQKMILRWNPDVVNIGELTTLEDIDFAKNISITWHTVLGTFHTEAVVEIWSRLKAEWINYKSFLQVLKLASAQRLLVVPYKTITLYNFLQNFNKYKDNQKYANFYEEWKVVLREYVLGQLIRPNILSNKVYIVEKLKELNIEEWRLKKIDLFYKLLKVYFYWNSKYEKYSKEIFDKLEIFIIKNLFIGDILTENEKDKIREAQWLGKNIDISWIKGRMPVFEFAILSDPNVRKIFDNDDSISDTILDQSINFISMFQDTFIRWMIFWAEWFDADKRWIKSFDLLNDTVLQWLAKTNYWINKWIKDNL